jgi:hypothetical protein
MRRILLCALLSVVAFTALLPNVASAQQAPDRVQIGRDIVIPIGEKVGDVVCVACSIRIHGQVGGSAVAVAGSITLGQGAAVAEDAVAVVGDVRLQSGARIGGGVTAVAGQVIRDPQATVAGDVVALGGAGWTLLIVLLPLLLFGGIIALIIWLVQRSRRAEPVPAHPANPR